MRATGSAIEVFHASRRIAAHARSYDPHRRYVTLPEHMPEAHRAVLDWPPSRLIAWGKSIGPATERVMELLLEKYPHPEQGFRSCRAILRLTKTYSAARLEAACVRAIRYRVTSYRSIAAILKNKLDMQDHDEPANQLALPLHGNVRGPGYYH